MDLNELSTIVFENNVNKGWWNERNRNIGEILALIHSEVSEALEDWRQTGDLVLEVAGVPVDAPKRPKWHGYHFEDTGKPVGFWSEIADVIIRCLDLAGRYQVDIDKIVHEKVDFNTGREYRHGGKHA